MSACLVMAMLLSGVFLVYNDRNFLSEELEKNKAFERLGEDDARSIHANVMAYLDGSARLDAGPFTPREVLHLADVKALFSAGQSVCYGSIAVFLGVYLYSVYSGRRRIHEMLGRFSNVLISASIVSLSVLMLLVISGQWFEKSFAFFHEVLFANDYWMLASTDMLILLYPQGFWQAVAAGALRISLLVSVFTLVCGLSLKMLKIEKKMKKK